MPWLALTIDVERAAAEAFSDALVEAGAHSVWLEPGGAVVAILSMESPADAMVREAAHSSGIALPRFARAMLDDQDWVRLSQAQFAPLAVGARLWVGASWHAAPAGRRIVRIDPGLAFGTGSHPSTRLVLQWLEKNLKDGERVLDYGCGSGILAIAAAKLGATQVDAVDLDPEAVETTRANARANGVALRVAPPGQFAPAVYDLVVANILAAPLIVLAPLLAPCAARLALSGILETQADEVARAYAPWLAMRVAERSEGWALLEGARR